MDDDKVEAHNLGGQFFSKDDIGMDKVDAIQSSLNRYANDEDFYGYCGRLTGDNYRDFDIQKFTVCAVDNMEARKLMFQCWKRHVASHPGVKFYFIDGRLSMDVLQVFAFSSEDTEYITQYERDFLFDSSEAENTVCSMKQTSYMANLIGGFMVNAIVGFASLECGEIARVPFKLEYDSNYMLMNLIM